MSKITFERLAEDVRKQQDKDNELHQADEPMWEAPSDEHEYVIAVGRQGTAIFLIAPLIHESFFENAKDLLDDNGFGIPDGLEGGIYKCHFHFWSSTDWESGHVDDWGFDCIGEPELLCSYEEAWGDEENS